MMEDESSSGGGLKKGPWTAEEDRVLVEYIEKNGHGSWRALPKLAGLNRCGKSCRLRWTNYLRPDIKRGNFSQHEQDTIIKLHALLGNKWSTIAGHLPGRTDNEIKNLWNTHLKKKLLEMGLDPVTHRPRSNNNNHHLINILLQHLLAAADNINNASSFTTTNALTTLALQQQQYYNTLIQALNLDLEAQAQLMMITTQNHQLNNHHPIPPCHNNFTNFEQPPFINHHQPLQLQPQPITTHYYYNNAFDSPTPPPLSLPNLVSPHHDCSPPSLKKMKTVFNDQDSIHTIPTSSTNFEMSPDLMPDPHQPSPAYWKHLLDQESNQPWSIS